MKPANVTDEDWAAARAKARHDLHRLARLVRAGLVHRDGSRVRLPLPAEANPTIRPNRKNRRKKR